MTKEQLYKLIAQGEGQRLEFKKSVAELDRIIQTLAAFANTNSDGGCVLIGIGDRGRVKEVIIGRETVRQIANKIAAHTDPVLYPEIEVIKESGNKGIIVITIDGSPNKPHLAFGRAYKRVGSTTTQMTRDEYERLLLVKHENKFQFDSQVCEGSTIEDIDEEKMKWFLRIARAKRGVTLNDEISVEEFLIHLQLVSKAGLTNAAVMLFGKSPHRFFLQSEIKCIALPTMEFIKPYTTYQAHGGNLFEQADKTLAFILDNIKRPLWIKAGEMTARHPYEIPEEAVREAVVNAIIHRDYMSPSKVQIRVFPNRVEIWNPGKLPPQLSVDDLRKPHPSLPYNPLLFRQFYRASYVEDVGGGTIDIIKSCTDANLPEPKFEQKMGSFILTIYRSPLTDEYLDNKKLSERQKNSISHIEKHGKMGRKEYEELYNVSGRTANRELNDLSKKGLIKKIGSGPGTYYVLARYGEIWRDK